VNMLEVRTTSCGGRAAREKRAAERGLGSQSLLDALGSRNGAKSSSTMASMVTMRWRGGNFSARKTDK